MFSRMRCSFCARLRFSSSWLKYRRLRRCFADDNSATCARSVSSSGALSTPGVSAAGMASAAVSDVASDAAAAAGAASRSNSPSRCCGSSAEDCGIADGDAAVSGKSSASRDACAPGSGVAAASGGGVAAASSICFFSRVTSRRNTSS